MSHYQYYSLNTSQRPFAPNYLFPYRSCKKTKLSKCIVSKEEWDKNPDPGIKELVEKYRREHVGLDTGRRIPAMTRARYSDDSPEIIDSALLAELGLSEAEAIADIGISRQRVSRLKSRKRRG